MTAAEKPADTQDHEAAYLDGHLLIAMPAMADPRFANSVIYLCAHSAEGAVGLVVNKPIDNLSFPELLEQLDIEPTGENAPLAVHFGGPVETQRGFILHSADFVEDETLVVDQNIALTATIDILREIAQGAGPRHILLALGYAGWGPGQLEAEFQDNAWLTAPADRTLVFETECETKWEKALAKLGIDQAMLSGTAGRA